MNYILSNPQIRPSYTTTNTTTIYCEEKLSEEEMCNSKINQEKQTLYNSILYLQAQCCIELGHYQEAEDFLLVECKSLYLSHVDLIRKKKKAAAAAAAGNGNNEKNKIVLQSLEEWILNNALDSTTNSGNGKTNTDTNGKATSSSTSSTNPSVECSKSIIPNGAAGLHLLAHIYQKTNRKEKAVTYFRMSLKLDPILWTSYEALCEMGVAATSAQDDPTVVFGVLPTNLAIIPSSQGGYGPEIPPPPTCYFGEESNIEFSTSKLYGESKEEMEGIEEHHGVSSTPFSVSATPFHGVQDSMIPSSSQQQQHQQRQQHHHYGDYTHAPTTQQSFAFTPGTPHIQQISESPNPNNHGGRGTLDSISGIGAIGAMGGMDGGDFHDNYDHFPSHFDEGTNSSQQFHLPTNLFHYERGGGGNVRGTASGTRGSASVVRNSRKSSLLPSTALFKTPGLTPIQSDSSQVKHVPTDEGRDGRVTSSTRGRRRGGGGGSSSSFTDPASGQYTGTKNTLSFSSHGTTTYGTNQHPNQPSNNDAVLSRAKQVVSRLYYDPSPETTPPHSTIQTIPHSSLTLSRSKRRLRRLSGYSNSGDGGGSTVLNDTKEEEVNEDEEEVQENRIEKRVLFGANTDHEYRKDESLDGPDIDEHEEIEEAQDDNNATGHEANHNQDNTDMNENHGIQSMLELLCTFGAAHRLLCTYRCREAIQVFRTLPKSQYLTGWVQHQIGRAYFEMADYPNTKRALEMMQELEPHRMKGLELLSTTLWQLKKEVDLSNLAQRVIDFDRMSPESWCVVGNCFSLQKEHETALSFFRRSIQLDSGFTYSHTLSGHEYVANEDFEQAMACYRNALSVDERHYTAWYGLGAIYFRQEKYDLSEYHFRKALSINPQSSVLHCHLGMAQHANGKSSDALETLAGAFRVDPRNPQARYQRATIWMSMDKTQEALEELERVRDAAPKESSVHFAMGRVLKRLGRLDEAMKSFLTALDLEPKDNNLIKAAIDRLDEPDMDEEVSTF